MLSSSEIIDFLINLYKKSGIRSKLSYEYQITVGFIIIILIIFCFINKENVIEFIEYHHMKINYLILKMISSSIVFLVCLIIFDKYTKFKEYTKFKKYIICLILFILIIFFVTFCINNLQFIKNTETNFNSPKHLEDQMVVAISPFYSEENGIVGSESITPKLIKMKLDERNDPRIKVLILNYSIRDIENARLTGIEKGAHLVIYGATIKNSYGSFIEYKILPIFELEIPTESSFFDFQTEKGNKYLIDPYFSMEDKPIKIIESLTENASSYIYAIYAFEKYKQSDFNSSINLFKNIINYENNSEILFYIANCYSHYNFNESLQYFDKAIKKNPQNAEAWNNKGNVLNKLKRYNESIEAFDEAIELDQTFAQPWNNKGNVFNWLERYNESIEAFDEAIRLDPNFSEAWNNKGNVLGWVDRTNESLEAFDEAIRLDPNFSDAWANKANVLSWNDKNEEALAACNNATKIDSKNKWAWIVKGDVLHGLHKYDEALAAYDRAIEIDRNDAWIWESKGDLLFILERYNEAFAAYNKTMEIDSEYTTWMWESKGDELFELKKYEEALIAYNKAIEIEQNDAMLWERKGNILFILERYDEAFTAYNKTMEIDPEYTWIWASKGDELYELKKFKEALVAYNKAIEINPDYTWLLQKKCFVLYFLGEYDEALKVCDHSIEISHNLNFGAKYIKGNVLFCLGKYNESLVAYNETIEVVEIFYESDENNTDFIALMTYAWYMKGIILINLDRYEEAENAFKMVHKFNQTYEIPSLNTINSTDICCESIN